LRTSGQYDSAIARILIESLELSLDPNELEPETDLRADLGLDSAALLELVLGIEAEFGVEIDVEEITDANFRTIGAISGFLHSRVGNRSGAAPC
jgi:acyl carrier protein